MRQFLKEGIKKANKEKCLRLLMEEKKKKTTQTYPGVEGIQLKKCSRWKAE